MIVLPTVQMRTPRVHGAPSNLLRAAAQTHTEAKAPQFPQQAQSTAGPHVHKEPSRCEAASPRAAASWQAALSRMTSKQTGDTETRRSATGPQGTSRAPRSPHGQQRRPGQHGRVPVAAAARGRAGQPGAAEEKAQREGGRAAAGAIGAEPR